MKLLNLTNKVHDLMQITKLYTVFDIMDDEAAAVRSNWHVTRSNVIIEEGFHLLAVNVF